MLKQIKRAHKLLSKDMKKINGGMVTINGVQLAPRKALGNRVCDAYHLCSPGYTCQDNRCM